MKKVLFAVLAIMLCAGLALAEPHQDEEKPENTTGIPDKVIEKCFFAGMETTCTQCHTKNGKLKEMEPFADKDTPYGSEYKYDVDGTLIGYYEISNISPDNIQNMLEYFDRDKNVNKIVFNVFSPGGSVFHAWKMINVIQRYYDRFDIEMRCDSAAFSAGFLIFLAGEKRYVNPYASMMMHELKSFEFFTMKSPSQLTEEAKLFEKWQNMINEWIAERTHIEVETIKEKTNFRDWWLTGREAVELGVAHGFLE